VICAIDKLVLGFKINALKMIMVILLFW
jgi:hypothetical protein